MDVRMKDDFSTKGPSFSPGPSRPRFDPPIRPPEERSRIFFPVDKCWLLEKHEGQDDEIYARVDMDMGPARLRRKYTVVPHVRKATIFLTSEEASVFHNWFEQIIGVGQLRWTGLFHDIGRGLRWFEAEFTKPWEAELVPLGEKNADGNAARGWKISIEVRLYGDGLIDKPGSDTSLTAFSANVRLTILCATSIGGIVGSDVCMQVSKHN